MVIFATMKRSNWGDFKGIRLLIGCMLTYYASLADICIRWNCWKTFVDCIISFYNYLFNMFWYWKIMDKSLLCFFCEFRIPAIKILKCVECTVMSILIILRLCEIKRKNSMHFLCRLTTADLVHSRKVSVSRKTKWVIHECSKLDFIFLQILLG